jgi:NADH dehydrogenase
MPHRILILGGGFGGLYAARQLKRAPVDVTLLDRRNFHLFQPLLYQVATGSLSPGEIAGPLRGILSRQRNTRVLLGEAVDIDPTAHRVTLRDGGTLDYDSLIVATGSSTSYFGNDSWREWAPSLKTVEEATAIRHKILYAFEAAERLPECEDRRAWLTFAIVGGGPTGVELAGALAEIARQTLKDEFRAMNPEDARILILDGAPRLLTAYPEDLSKKAEYYLLRMGVRVRSGVRVTKVDANGVDFRTPGGTVERLPARTVLWAGGVSAGEFGKVLVSRTNAPVDKGGRILVNPDLTIPNYPDIFVVGDQAAIPTGEGKTLPGVAQVAMQSGAFAARTIVARSQGKADLKPFHYRDLGDMAVIGRAAAVGRVFGVHVWGFPAWLIWLFIHLMQLVEFSNRVQVFVQWGFQYLTFNRGARLITGPAASDTIIGTQTLKSTADSSIP